MKLSFSIILLVSMAFSCNRKHKVPTTDEQLNVLATELYGSDHEIIINDVSSHGLIIYSHSPRQNDAYPAIKISIIDLATMERLNELEYDRATFELLDSQYLKITTYPNHIPQEGEQPSGPKIDIIDIYTGYKTLKRN